MRPFTPSSSPAASACCEVRWYEARLSGSLAPERSEGGPAWVMGTVGGRRRGKA